MERVDTLLGVTGVVGALFPDSTGGCAWPFLLGEVICLVNSLNERYLSSLNSAQHASYLTTSYKDIVCAAQGSSRQNTGVRCPSVLNVVRLWLLLN